MANSSWITTTKRIILDHGESWWIGPKSWLCDILGKILFPKGCLSWEACSPFVFIVTICAVCCFDLLIEHITTCRNYFYVYLKTDQWQVRGKCTRNQFKTPLEIMEFPPESVCSKAETLLNFYDSVLFLYVLQLFYTLFIYTVLFHMPLDN